MVVFRDTGQVVDGVYLIDIGIWGIEKQMAIYIIKSSDLTALIDTGTKKESKTVLRELQSLGITLDYIIVTHSHIDHCGAIYQIAKNFPNATICIPNLAQDLKKEYAKKSKRLGFSNPLKLLKEESVIKLDSNFILKVLETPGHIADHLSILDLKHQILFVGDACGSHHLGKNFSRPTAYAPYFNHEAYINSLLRFQEINPKGLGIASYGFATHENAKNCIQSAINDYHNWKQSVIEIIRENPEENYVACALLQKFGRSPGEIKENRSEQWIKTILIGIARGFINSLGLKKI
ncbi:MAG: MBL fold metallo-hydrolase [Promethearchaeota archaeon]